MDRLFSTSRLRYLLFFSILFLATLLVAGCVSRKTETVPEDSALQGKLGQPPKVVSGQTQKPPVASLPRWTVSLQALGKVIALGDHADEFAKIICKRMPAVERGYVEYSECVSKMSGNVSAGLANLVAAVEKIQQGRGAVFHKNLAITKDKVGVFDQPTPEEIIAALIAALQGIQFEDPTELARGYALDFLWSFSDFLNFAKIRVYNQLKKSGEAKAPENKVDQWCLDNGDNLPANGDQDLDGVRNASDNCPCHYNPNGQSEFTCGVEGADVVVDRDTPLAIELLAHLEIAETYITNKISEVTNASQVNEIIAATAEFTAFLKVYGTPVIFASELLSENQLNQDWSGVQDDGYYQDYDAYLSYFAGIHDVEQNEDDYVRKTYEDARESVTAFGTSIADLDNALIIEKDMWALIVDELGDLQEMLSTIEDVEDLESLKFFVNQYGVDLKDEFTQTALAIELRSEVTKAHSEALTDLSFLFI